MVYWDLAVLGLLLDLILTVFSNLHDFMTLNRKVLTELQGKTKQYTGGRSRQSLASKNVETLPRHIGSVRKFIYGVITTWNHQQFKTSK